MLGTAALALVEASWFKVCDALVQLYLRHISGLVFDRTGRPFSLPESTGENLEQSVWQLAFRPNESCTHPTLERKRSF
jgi:hypothetical protein